MSESNSPAKWRFVSWQKKDEQFARIPQAWRLTSLPSADTTNYTAVPRDCGLLSEQELRITEDYDATALAVAIRSRELRCVDVTRAFCKVSMLQCSSPPFH
jgi:amidase